MPIKAEIYCLHCNKKITVEFQQSIAFPLGRIIVNENRNSPKRPRGVNDD